MMLIVTPNPSVDRVLDVPELRPGEVHRARTTLLQPGGKGLNVARIALIWGAAIEATGPLAGFAGRHLASLAAAENIPSSWIWVETGETRSCTLAVHSGRDTTVINEPGEPLPAEAWERLAAHVRARAGDAADIAFCGSLPPGIPPAALVELARELAAEREVWVDTHGPSLVSVLENPAGLHVKVNHHELAAAWGGPVDPAEGARELVRRGAASAALTLGGDGVILVTADEILRGRGPEVTVRSSVGAGDAFLAGLVTARREGLDWRGAAVRALASGAACCASGRPGWFERRAAEALACACKMESWPP